MYYQVTENKTLIYLTNKSMFYKAKEGIYGQFYSKMEKLKSIKFVLILTSIVFLTLVAIALELTKV